MSKDNITECWLCADCGVDTARQRPRIWRPSGHLTRTRTASSGMITTPKDYTPIFELRLQIQRRGRGRSCHAGVVRISQGTNGHAAAEARLLLPDWSGRLLQELSTAQDQTEFCCVFAAYRERLDSLAPRQYEMLVGTVNDLLLEHAT